MALGRIMEGTDSPMRHDPSVKEPRQMSLTDLIDEASASFQNLAINFVELREKLSPILDRNMTEKGEADHLATTEPARPDEKIIDLTRNIKNLNEEVRRISNRTNI
jgi:hypothetical protein